MRPPWIWYYVAIVDAIWHIVLVCFISAQQSAAPAASEHAVVATGFDGLNIDPPLWPPLGIPVSLSATERSLVVRWLGIGLTDAVFRQYGSVIFRAPQNGGFPVSLKTTKESGTPQKKYDRDPSIRLVPTPPRSPLPTPTPLPPPSPPPRPRLRLR